MNRIELELKRRENINKLDIAYRSNLNRIEYNPSESIEHFLAKTICFVLLKKGFPANQLQDVMNGIFFEGKTIPKPIVLLGQKFEHEWKRPVVVTEARFKEKNWQGLRIQRRADLFILDTGEIIEIETGKSYPKEDDVIVVKI